MKITVFGAVGDVGRRIVREALARGHAVTGMVRTKARFALLPEGVSPCAVDVLDMAHVMRNIERQDVIISALRPPQGHEQALVTLTGSVLDDAAAVDVRVLVVGGAGRLMLPGRGGETVLSAPDFLPESVVPIARACQAQYELCLSERRVDWSYLSPPAMLAPGERTGRYRLGTDTLMVDENGDSHISIEDFAVAMLDEAEAPKHLRHAFTVGY